MHWVTSFLLKRILTKMVKNEIRRINYRFMDHDDVVETTLWIHDDLYIIKIILSNESKRQISKRQIWPISLARIDAVSPKTLSTKNVNIPQKTAQLSIEKQPSDRVDGLRQIPKKNLEEEISGYHHEPVHDIISERDGARERMDNMVQKIMQHTAKLGFRTKWADMEELNVYYRQDSFWFIFVMTMDHRSWCYAVMMTGSSETIIWSFFNVI